MTLTMYHCWRLEYLVIGRGQWQHEHATNEWLRNYQVLDLSEATRALFEIARRDMDFVRKVGREALEFLESMEPPQGNDQRAHADRHLLASLQRMLGIFSAPGQPPDFARLYVCRRKRAAPAFQPPPDPHERIHEAIEMAKKAPRGYVAAEAVTEAGAPAPGLRLEILLADGELLTCATDSAGRLYVAPVPQGRCHIRVLDLDGSAWRPDGGEASSCVERKHKRSHTVVQGENLTRVAERYGIAGWKTIWNAAENETLRKKRTDPHVLRPGDELVVPGIAIHAISRPTDQTHRIVVRSARPVLALLNAHLVKKPADVDVRWSGGGATLAASNDLFRDDTSMSVRLNEVAAQPLLALVPAIESSEQPTTSAEPVAARGA